MKLPAAHAGAPLLVQRRELDFSFHMMRRAKRRWGTHSMLYAADPWSVVSGSIGGQISSVAERSAANSFVRQAREYFVAAERATSIETRPLLYYYSFLNLGKAISIARGRSGLVGKVSHGVASIYPSGHTAPTAELVIQASPAVSTAPRSAVDELHRALEGIAVPAGVYPVRDIIAQSVVAHRMWREAFAQPRAERFMTVDRVRFYCNVSLHQIWTRIYLRRDTLRARNRSLTDLLSGSTLAPDFRAVADPNSATGEEFHVLEQVNPIPYSGRPSDVVMQNVALLRTRLWQTVTAAPPYRRFYLYLSPPGEKRVPQWLSIYMTLFWLGSLTRYQPVELLEALDGPYGPFLREFLQSQPSQLLYILASEVKRQDVTKAAIV